VPLHDFAERVPGVDLQGRENLIGLFVEGDSFHVFVQWMHGGISLVPVGRLLSAGEPVSRRKSLRST